MRDKVEVMQESEHNSGLVRELLQQGAESEWVEFKHNNEDPALIGRLVSALANGAAIAGKAYGYAVWGIEDSTHVVVGTSFNPNNLIAGNQSLTNWLATQLEPEVYFKFLNETYFGKSFRLCRPRNSQRWKESPTRKCLSCST